MGRPMSLADRIPPRPGAAPDELLDLFLGHVKEIGLELYPAQEQAILELFTGNNVILSTPTGSGKSLVALALHFYAASQGKRSYYSAPTRAHSSARSSSPSAAILVLTVSASSRGTRRSIATLTSCAALKRSCRISRSARAKARPSTASSSTNFTTTRTVSEGWRGRFRF